MTAQELKTGEISIEWSEDFQDIVNKVNEKWKCNSPKIPDGFLKINNNTELLSEGTKVQIKLEDPISVLGKKLHGKFRTGDIRWDPEIQIIKKLILSPEQPPIYLLNGPYGNLGVSRCAYTRKQLQLVPDYENPPPSSVIRDRLQRYVLEKILKQRIRKG